MLAPFVSQGIMWLAREWANEWLAERKAQAPTRRAERYLHQMTKQLSKLKPNDPTRSPLELKIAQLTDRLHEHKLSQLELKNAPIASPPASDQ